MLVAKISVVAPEPIHTVSVKRSEVVIVGCRVTTVVVDLRELTIIVKVVSDLPGVSVIV
jgi:hypothetical protein